MALKLLPANIRHLAADPKHPFYDPKYINRADLVIFVNNAVITGDRITVVDVDNGYVKFKRNNLKGKPQVRVSKNKGLNGRLLEGRIKGRVELFLRTDEKDEDA